MKILLTGATGYIGKRLLPLLVEKGHHVVCCTRDIRRFHASTSLKPFISIIEIDLLDKQSLEQIPEDIDAAYYLVHSMASGKDYRQMEEQSATHFRQAVSQTQAKQVIFLSGIINENNLSQHLLSRKTVEHELAKGDYAFTCLRAGIIVGSGSASFEIMRDLVEKLPIMITPKWLKTRCQPIGIYDVLQFLTKSLANSETYHQHFDIGCNDVLTYKEMLLQLAEVRELNRTIITVPVMTPRLSSYWLYFVTSTSFNLAQSLVDSMKVEMICADNRLARILDIHPLSYKEAVQRAFQKVENNEIVSSWKDSYQSSGLTINISDFISVPEYGCMKDKRESVILDRQACIDKIWSIGGDNGWYAGNWLWQIRGFLDKMVGGVGLRRGRTSQTDIAPGDALDFWRVLYANKKEGRLLLFAEMKLPGEAWLEFSIKGNVLHQTATFRPRGLAGRLYWYAVLPFHGFIFEGMINTLSSATST